MTTDAEKAARAWLDAFCRDPENENARCIKALLAEPRLPAEPSVSATADAISHMGICISRTDKALMAEAIRLYHNHMVRRLTAPKTKTEHFKRWLVVWKRGEHGPFADEDDARRCAKAWGNAAVIELTGTGEVPND